MKKIKSVILRWRFHRLYRRLFWLFLERNRTADEAAYEAANAFVYLTGCDWDDWR